MSATLMLLREGFGIELRHGPFEVYLDGAPAGTLAHRHETVEVQVQPGSHSLQIRSGRYSSQSRPFEAADGEVVRFRCHPPMVWVRYLASFLKPDLAISLRRE